VKSLEPRYIAMLEGAYFAVCPKEGVASQFKKRDPAEAFIRRVLYDDLSTKTLEEAINSMRKLDWEDHDVGIEYTN